MRRIVEPWPAWSLSEPRRELWPTAMWQNMLGIEQAGRSVLFRTSMLTDMTKMGPDMDLIHTMPVEQVYFDFRLTRYIYPVFITTERGEDELGEYERGYEFFFYCYIPIPRENGVQWLIDVAKHEFGVELTEKATDAESS